ncbi:hypothetical protein GCM10022261_03090 [Brevibacterium daeguense]|uniref:Tripartite ATP-independent periplasmic transporters DctQ component domain-containing protein n=1 Tax=Brevibacterium daeguense TaxID=909936 RepID=A0ABP8EFM4_9MICO|nr:TRAP transporter small permease [Brevibacterium daeguense]
MQTLDRVSKSVSLTLAVLAASVIAVIMIMTTADVIKRFFTGSSIPGTAEFSEVFLVVAVYFGLAYAMRTGAHVGVDLVLMRLKPRAAKIVQVTGLTIGIVILVWMTFETVGTAMHSIAVNEFRYGIIKVPVWPAKLAIPLGLLALILECLVTMGRVVAGDSTASGDPETEAELELQPPQGL